VAQFLPPTPRGLKCDARIRDADRAGSFCLVRPLTAIFGASPIYKAVFASGLLKRSLLATPSAAVVRDQLAHNISFVGLKGMMDDIRKQHGWNLRLK